MFCGMWVCFAEGIGQMWMNGLARVRVGEDWTGELVYLVSVGE